VTAARTTAAGVVLVLALAGAGCRQDMHDQPKYQPFEASAFFADGRASRPRVPGTVARGQLYEDALFHTGAEADGAFTTVFPFAITRAVLERGRERFDIYCSPCHDRVGHGNGIVVQRGFKRPPSLHDERVRAMPPGYFFSVISGGFGVMSGYAAQVPASDRWAITAYVRALQLSQHAVLAEWPPAVRAPLAAAASAPASASARAAASAPAAASDRGHGHD
jgi:hypothetical protein